MYSFIYFMNEWFWIVVYCIYIYICINPDRLINKLSFFHCFSAGLWLFSGNHRRSFDRQQEADGKRIYMTLSGLLQKTIIKLRLSPNYPTTWLCCYWDDRQRGCESLLAWGGLRSGAWASREMQTEIATGCKLRRTDAHTGMWWRKLQMRGAGGRCGVGTVRAQMNDEFVPWHLYRNAAEFRWLESHNWPGYDTLHHTAHCPLVIPYRMLLYII